MQEIDRVAAVLGGRYRVERELGRGGMGVVYLATDTQLDRRIAVKVLCDGMSADHAERFLREVRVLSSLQHPNVVPLHDAGSTAGVTWYSMPYVEGESLRDRLERGPLAPADAVSLLRDVASAVDAAHGKGIIHRDVKPANILLTGNRALLADFGVARALATGADTDRTLTQTGTAVGSPDYMAPEQLAGIPLDGKADQFSLACVAYEALSGRLPFGASGATTRSPRSPAASVAERFTGLAAPLPDSLALGGANDVLARALAPDPTARYGSCAEFVSAFEAALATKAPRTPWAKHRREVAIALGILIVAVGATFMVRLTRRPATASRPTRLLVLPIRNDASERLAWLASGLTDELTSHVGRVPGLAVIARSTASELASDKRSLIEIARALDVAHIVTARLAPDADSGWVRVRAALVRGQDETEVWSETVRVDLADIRAGEAQLARTVGAGLRGVLGTSAIPAQLARTSPEVFELLLSAGGGDGGTFGWAPDRVARADSLLQRAIALDHNATEAHARLALLRAAWLWVPMPSRELDAALERARQPASRALVLDSMNVTANIAMAFIGLADARLDETERRARRVLALHAEHADALEMLGSVALCAGKYEDAQNYFSRALAADLLNPDHAASLSITELVGFGRAESARELETRSLELWESRGQRAETGARVLARQLALGVPFEVVAARAAEERARRPGPWAGSVTYGPSEDIEWALATKDDWQWMDSAFAGRPEHSLVQLRRAVAEGQWSKARRLAASVRSNLLDASFLLGWKHQLQIALTFMLERDTTAALAIVRDIERGGCGRPTRFGNEVALVTYPAMARVLAGDTAGAIRGLEAAFEAKPWPTREALRYHPILGPVLGFPNARAPR